MGAQILRESKGVQSQHRRSKLHPMPAASHSARSGGRGRGAGRGRGGAKSGHSGLDKLTAVQGGARTGAQDRVIERAKKSDVPPHMCLGITLQGLRAILDPSHDGYAVRAQARDQAKTDGLSACERLQKKTPAHVGVATIYLIWHAGTSVSKFLEALDNLIASTSCTPGETCFFVRDLCVRQTATRAAKDLERLQDTIAAIGQTVLLLQSHQLACQSAPLRCAFCVAELTFTAAARCPFDVMLSDADEDILHRRLVHFLGVFAGALNGPSARVVDWYVRCTSTPTPVSAPHTPRFSSPPTTCLTPADPFASAAAVPRVAVRRNTRTRVTCCWWEKTARSSTKPTPTPPRCVPGQRASDSGPTAKAACRADGRCQTRRRN